MENKRRSQQLWRPAPTTRRSSNLPFNSWWWTRCNNTDINNNNIHNKTNDNKVIKKLIKDIDETQLFLANESNRVDQELEQVKTTGHDLHVRLCEVEDTTVTDQWLDHQVQLINQRLDDYHDELHDQATAIYNQKNIMNGILAGHRLQRAEPSSVWTISALKTIDQMAEQMNRQTDLINRLQARVDVLEFRQLPRPGAIIDSDNNNSDNNNIVTQCQY